MALKMMRRLRLGLSTIGGEENGESESSDEEGDEENTPEPSIT